MRAVIVDLLCNSPFYCAPLTRALTDVGVDAELASPRFYLEPRFMDEYRRSRWIHEFAVHVPRLRLVRLAVRAVEGLFNYARLLSRIRARAYDVVHIQWIPFEETVSPFMPILRWLCDRTGTLLVLTVHNAVPQDRLRGNQAAFKRNLDCAHVIVALSEHVAMTLSQSVRPVSPVVIIPVAPLFADYRLPPRHEAAARIGYAAGPIVLFLGLIKPYKGLDLLSEAWQEVRSSFPDAALFVVGKVLGEAAANDVQRLREHDGVYVIDRYVPVAEMLDLHAAADVVVFPYRRVSQSGAVMTAAGLGRPTVVTPLPGLIEQVSRLESAIVADEVTGAGIARALKLSLERREELAGAAERDRDAIADSPVGRAAIASATIQAYASNLRILRRQS